MDAQQEPNFIIIYRATCLPENPASARVLEKVGMRKEGFLVKNLKIHGEWRSSFLYAILTEEWSEPVSS